MDSFVTGWFMPQDWRIFSKTTRKGFARVTFDPVHDPPEKDRVERGRRPWVCWPAGLDHRIASFSSSALVENAAKSSLRSIRITACQTDDCTSCPLLLKTTGGMGGLIEGCVGRLKRSRAIFDSLAKWIDLRSRTDLTCPVGGVCSFSINEAPWKTFAQTGLLIANSLDIDEF